MRWLAKPTWRAGGVPLSPLIGNWLELNIMSEDHPSKATYIAHHCTVMKSADVCWEVDVPSLPKVLRYYILKPGLQNATSSALPKKGLVFFVEMDWTRMLKKKNMIATKKNYKIYKGKKLRVLMEFWHTSSQTILCDLNHARSPWEFWCSTNPSTSAFTGCLSQPAVPKIAQVLWFLNDSRIYPQFHSYSRLYN